MNRREFLKLLGLGTLLLSPLKILAKNEEYWDGEFLAEEIHIGPKTIFIKANHPLDINCTYKIDIVEPVIKGNIFWAATEEDLALNKLSSYFSAKDSYASSEGILMGSKFHSGKEFIKSNNVLIKYRKT